MTNPGSVTTQQVTEWMIEEGVTDKQFQFFDDEEQFMKRRQKHLVPIVFSIQPNQKRLELV